MTKIAIEHGPVEIVSFPMNSMGIFHSYVQLAEGRFPLVGWFSYIGLKLPFRQDKWWWHTSHQLWADFDQKDMIEHQIRTGWHSDPPFFGEVVDLFSEQTTFLAKTHPVLETADFPLWPWNQAVLGTFTGCVSYNRPLDESCTRHQVDHCFHHGSLQKQMYSCEHTHTIRSTLYRHLWINEWVYLAEFSRLLLLGFLPRWIKVFCFQRFLSSVLRANLFEEKGREMPAPIFFHSPVDWLVIIG